MKYLVLIARHITIRTASTSRITTATTTKGAGTTTIEEYLIKLKNHQ